MNAPSEDGDFCAPAVYADRVRAVLEKLQPLYTPYDAVIWLNSQQVLMWNDRPSQLLATHGGTVKVMETIERLLDGAHI